MLGSLILYSLTGALPTGAESFPVEGALTLAALFQAVLFGLAGLLWAFLFKIIFGGARRLAARLDRYPVLKPAVGGLIFGLVGAWQPLTLFSGEKQLVEVLRNGAEIGVATLIVLAVLKLFTLSVCLATGFPGGFVFPLFLSAGSLGYAVHLLMPAIPLSVCIAGMMAGIGGAVMRMPFTVILLLVVLTNPALLPVSVLAAVTSFLTAGILDAGSARKALLDARAGRQEVYGEER
jgi:H+/Cl- antiporter ClcA